MKAFPLALLLASLSCASRGGDDVDIDFPVVVDVDAFCDGNASAFDWLFVMSAQTDIEAYDVSCEVEQYGDSFGVWGLNDQGDGQHWYGEVWEDDLGVDCEGPSITVSCEAE